MKIKGVIFDLDGTLIDAPYDWPRIKADLDTGGQPILRFLSDLQEPEKSRKWKVLENYEETATAHAVLKEGVPELLQYLEHKHIRTALVSNNSQKNVSLLTEKFSLRFDLVLSRDSGMSKPSAHSFRHILHKWKFQKAECGVVGDAFFDVQAAEAAGIDLVWIISQDPDKFKETKSEVVGSIFALQERISQVV